MKYTEYACGWLEGFFAALYIDRTELRTHKVTITATDNEACRRFSVGYTNDKGTYVNLFGGSEEEAEAILKALQVLQSDTL